MDKIIDIINGVCPNEECKHLIVENDEGFHIQIKGDEAEKAIKAFKDAGMIVEVQSIIVKK